MTRKRTDIEKEIARLERLHKKTGDLRYRFAALILQDMPMTGRTIPAYLKTLPIRAGIFAQMNRKPPTGRPDEQDYGHLVRMAEVILLDHIAYHHCPLQSAVAAAKSDSATTSDLAAAKAVAPQAKGNSLKAAMNRLHRKFRKDRNSYIEAAVTSDEFERAMNFLRTSPKAITSGARQQGQVDQALKSVKENLKTIETRARQQGQVGQALKSVKEDLKTIDTRARQVQATKSDADGTN